MRKFLCSTVIACLACSVMAGGLDKVLLALSNVSTGTAAASQTTSTKITGYIERIDLTFFTNTTVVCPKVIVSNELTGLTQTILDLADISTGAVYYPRFDISDVAGATGFTNESKRFMVLNETVYLSTTNASTSNQNVKAFIFYERP